MPHFCVLKKPHSGHLFLLVFCIKNTFDDTRFIKGIINICILMNYMLFYQPLLSIIPFFTFCDILQPPRLAATPPIFSIRKTQGEKRLACVLLLSHKNMSLCSYVFKLFLCLYRRTQYNCNVALAHDSCARDKKQVNLFCSPLAYRDFGFGP